jgi:hypothetical protein
MINPHKTTLDRHSARLPKLTLDRHSSADYSSTKHLSSNIYQTHHYLDESTTQLLLLQPLISYNIIDHPSHSSPYIRRCTPFGFMHHFLLLPFFFSSYLVLQWQIAFLSSSLAFLLQGSCPSSLFLFRAEAACVQQSPPEIFLSLSSRPSQNESFKLSQTLCFSPCVCGFRLHLEQDKEKKDKEGKVLTLSSL